jgi:hypothetical protein
MLVKVNGIINEKRIEQKKGEEERRVKVTLLDIDDLGSVIPVKELELRLPPNDESIAKILASSRYAAIFTEGDNDEERSDIIIMANGITEEELNNEKKKMIDKADQVRN